jgi:hypothetical protein
MTIEYANGKSILNIFTVELTIEEQKRLYTSKKEDHAQLQSNGISGFANLPAWKMHPDVGRFLSTLSGHNEGAVQHHTPTSQEKSDIKPQHDFEVVNGGGGSAI